MSHFQAASCFGAEPLQVGLAGLLLARWSCSLAITSEPEFCQVGFDNPEPFRYGPSFLGFCLPLLSAAMHWLILG